MRLPRLNAFMLTRGARQITTFSRLSSDLVILCYSKFSRVNVNL